MLSEEGFILVGVGVACVLLVLGILELLWPTRPRQRARQPAVPPTDDFEAPLRGFEPPLLTRTPIVFTPPEPPPPIFPTTPRPIATLSDVEPFEAETAPVEPVAAESLEVEQIEILPESEPVEVAPRAVIAMPDEAPPEIEEIPPTVEEAPAVEVASEAPQPEVVRYEEAPHEEAPHEPAPHEETAHEVAPLDVVPPAETPPPRKLRRSKVSPHARPHRVLRGARKTQTVEPAATTSEGGTVAKLAAPPARESFWATAGLPEPVPEARAGRDSPLVETCFAMYQEKRYDEVVTRAEAELANIPEDLPTSLLHETAALWAVLALAKQALGDDEGAAAALASAIDTAPDHERATYRRHFATLTLDAARIRLSRARSHEIVDRVGTIRSAIAWIDRGLAVSVDDAGLTDLRDTAYESLWSAYERAVAGLLQRQDFNGARLLLREPLEDPALPPARAEGFHTMFGGTFGGEVGQLTAQAIRNLQESRESDALDSLQRAEDLLATIPSESLPAKRREEVEQRLWWAYTELGRRRVTAGDAEKALAPLRHALGFEDIGPDRQAETRSTLVHALEGVATARLRTIRRLAEGGQRPAAVARTEELRALLQSYIELGLTEEELIAATRQVRLLCADLGFADHG